MIHKLKVYYKVHRDFPIIALPLIFVLLAILVNTSARELSDRNIGVILMLFGPPLFLAIFTRLITFEAQYGFENLLTTYQEPRYRIFLYKYLLGLLLFAIPITISTIITLFHPSAAMYDLFPAIGRMLSVAFVVGNLAIVLAIGGNRMEYGLIGGLLVFLAIIRVPVPAMVFTGVFPIFATLFGVSALWLFEVRR